MSFEGYWRVLCENGHLEERPYNYGNYYQPKYEPCKVCRADIVWMNLVDQTNDAGKQDIILLTKKTEAVPCACKCCGNQHVAEEETYHIPTESVYGKSWYLLSDEQEKAEEALV